MPKDNQFSIERTQVPFDPELTNLLYEKKGLLLIVQALPTLNPDSNELQLGGMGNSYLSKILAQALHANRISSGEAMRHLAASRGIDPESEAFYQWRKNPGQDVDLAIDTQVGTEIRTSLESGLITVGDSKLAAFLTEFPFVGIAVTAQPELADDWMHHRMVEQNQKITLSEVQAIRASRYKNDLALYYNLYTVLTTPEAILERSQYVIHNNAVLEPEALNVKMMTELILPIFNHLLMMAEADEQQADSRIDIIQHTALNNLPEQIKNQLIGHGVAA